MLQLGSAAKIAGLDVLTYVAGHLRPPVVAGDQFQCFETTWVARDVHVVVLLNYPLAKLAVLRHINLPSKHHQPFALHSLPSLALYPFEVRVQPLLSAPPAYRLVGSVELLGGRRVQGLPRAHRAVR